MGIMTTADFIRSLMPGVDKQFGEDVKEEAYHRMMFSVLTNQAGQAERLDSGHSGYPMFSEKPEAAPIALGSAGQEHVWRYTPQVWALMIAVTRELIEDTNNAAEASNLIFKNTKGLAISGRATREALAASIYNNGFDTAYTMKAGSDGLPMFSASHPSKVTGLTTSNLLTVASQLNEAALEDAATQVALWSTAYGIKAPRKLTTLIVHPSNRFEAHRLLQSGLRPGSANNDTNAIKDLGIIKDVAHSPYLLSPTAWFVRTDSPTDSPVLREWRAMKIEGAYNAHDLHVAYITASFRVAFGWTGSKGVIGTPGF